MHREPHTVIIRHDGTGYGVTVQHYDGVMGVSLHDTMAEAMQKASEAALPPKFMSGADLICCIVGLVALAGICAAAVLR